MGKIFAYKPKPRDLHRQTVSSQNIIYIYNKMVCGSSLPKIADKGIMVTVESKRNIMSCQEVADNIHPSANEVLLHKRN
jgi:hypothetical protein